VDTTHPLAINKDHCNNKDHRNPFNLGTQSPCCWAADPGFAADSDSTFTTAPQSSNIPSLRLGLRKTFIDHREQAQRLALTARGAEPGGHSQEVGLRRRKGVSGRDDETRSRAY
jgi:hypothetical protein